MALTFSAGAIAWLRPPAGVGASFDQSAHAVFAALADVLLDGSLPTDAAARRGAIEQHLLRVQQTVAGLPPQVRAELARLLTLLDTFAGRWLLMGVASRWTAMEPVELVAALDRMRRSSLSLRQQAYLALRELTMASYFADPGTWGQLGYPGPMAI